MNRKRMLEESQKLLNFAKAEPAHSSVEDHLIDAIELLVDVANKDRWYLRIVTFAAIALVLILYFSDLFASYIAKFFVGLFG